MGNRLGFVLSVSFASVLTACGGGGSIAFEDLEETQIREACERAVACGDYETVEDCLAANDGFDPSLSADVEAGIILYDGDAARECLDALADLPFCVLIFDGPEYDAAQEACDDVFTGTVESGGDCFDSQECVDGLTCVTTDPQCADACCAGTCEDDTTPPDAEIGSSCAEANCVSNAYCDADNLCAALLEEGEACEDLFSCVTGALCDLDFTTGVGTCIHLAARGEECDPQALFGCLSFADYCDTTSSTCEQRKDVGETCDVELSNCRDYAYCDAGTCAARPGEGEACTVDSEAECLGETECTAGSCSLPDAGEPCTL